MPLTQSIFDMMACDLFEDEPDVYYQHLRVSPKVRCFEEPHKTWFATALFFLCIYTVGIPAAAFSVLFFNRKHLEGKADNSTFFQQTFGFISAGYRLKYWEVTVVMVRKVFFVFIVTMLASTTTLIQTHCAIVFIVACLALHLRCKPYDSSTLDHLETLSLCSTFVTLYGGVFYFIDLNGRSISGLRSSVTYLLIIWHSVVAFIMVLTGARLWFHQRVKSMAKKRRKSTTSDSTQLSPATEDTLDA